MVQRSVRTRHVKSCLTFSPFVLGYRVYLNDDTFPSVHSSTDKDNFLYEDKNSSNLVFRSYLKSLSLERLLF